jgi:hypothetical protein
MPSRHKSIDLMLRVKEFVPVDSPAKYNCFADSHKAIARPAPKSRTATGAAVASGAAPVEVDEVGLPVLAAVAAAVAVLFPIIRHFQRDREH